MTGKLRIVALLPNPSAWPAPLKCVGIVSGKVEYWLMVKAQIARSIIHPRSSTSLSALVGIKVIFGLSVSISLRLVYHC